MQGSLIFTEEFGKNVTMKFWKAIWTLFISTIDLIYIMAFEVWTGDEQILSSYLYALVAMQRKPASYFIVGWKIPSLGLLSRINKPAVDMSIITDR